MSISSDSECSSPANIYEEELNEATTLDLSKQELEIVPEIHNNWLTILCLQNNKLRTLPENLFPSLPRLMWIDLRDNLLTELPKSIKNHPKLTHMLLQNNNITCLPNELGTVKNLNVLQLSGNPLVYPPKEIINQGIAEIVVFLNNKYLEEKIAQSQIEISEDQGSTTGDTIHTIFNPEVISYNSVIDEQELKNNKLTVQLNERDLETSDDDGGYYAKFKGKCSKLAKSRYEPLPPYYQSAKYVKPLCVVGKNEQNERIRRSFLKDKAIIRHKELLAKREKILQDRKNVELIKAWRRNYRNYQLKSKDGTYKLEAKDFPFDTNPEYMTLLNREDIEKDLPDKYRKKLVRRAKPTLPRKNNSDVHLAIKIKKLFENLESIDLNREGMTPRTEQKVLLNEIQKISEIKQKLMELSSTNARSVLTD